MTGWLGVAAALSAALAVVAGAFGAHGAGTEKAAALFRTGAEYQLVHAVAALVALSFGARGQGWCFVAGALLFSGSIYWLALGAPRWVGPVTPIGGAVMIVGWLWLAWRLRG